MPRWQRIIGDTIVASLALLLLFLIFFPGCLPRARSEPVSPCPRCGWPLVPRQPILKPVSSGLLIQCGSGPRAPGAGDPTVDRGARGIPPRANLAEPQGGRGGGSAVRYYHMSPNICAVPRIPHTREVANA